MPREYSYETHRLESPTAEKRTQPHRPRRRQAASLGQCAPHRRPARSRCCRSARHVPHHTYAISAGNPPDDPCGTLPRI